MKDVHDVTKLIGDSDSENEYLTMALEFLGKNEVQEALQGLDGKEVTSDSKKLTNAILDEFFQKEKWENREKKIGFERAAKDNGAKWRVVIDFPIELVENEDDIYKYKAPIIQFCSGSPKYNRYVLSFKKEGVKDDVVDNCIKTPTQDELENVVSGVKDSSFKYLSKKRPNLKQVKEFYDNAGIQRIAILGTARIFPDMDKLSKLEEKQDRNLEEQQQLKDLRWAKKYTDRVKEEVNAFFKYMDKEAGQVESLNGKKILNNKIQYTTVNGGWAGVQEGSKGVPKMASELGLGHSRQDAGAKEKEDYGYYPPITIMPQGGNHDRVKTMADIKNELRGYVSDKILENFGNATGLEETKTVSKDNGKKLNDSIISKAISVAADATYFEILGVWGDDSRYLVSMSTSLLVFDPHGLWTDIEIANGIAQGKPIAIIADTDNLGEYGVFNKQGFVQEEGYRVYKEASGAAEWINRQWNTDILQQSISRRRSYGDLGKAVGTQSWMQSQEKILKQESKTTESKVEELSQEASSSRRRSMTI